MFFILLTIFCENIKTSRRASLREINTHLGDNIYLFKTVHKETAKQKHSVISVTDIDKKDLKSLF